MLHRAFVDTSALFAYVNRKDPAHAHISQRLDQFEGRLISSNFVLDETITLCRYRLNHAAALKIGRILLDPEVIELKRISPEDEKQAWDLFALRSDQKYSFTDCTSFVLMRRLGIIHVFARDSDFEKEGFTVG